MRVVGGHVGFPWVDEVVSLSIKFPNFYVDTSAYGLHRLPDGFVAYLRGIGAGRVMFGTNWPMFAAALPVGVGLAGTVRRSAGIISRRYRAAGVRAVTRSR